MRDSASLAADAVGEAQDRRGFWALLWSRNWAALARRDRTRFINDVFVRPSVGSGAGWLIGLLFLLVAYLTIEYAPGAPGRAQQAHGADPDGVITVAIGYCTVAVVAFVALLVGFWPQLAQLLDEWGQSGARRWLGRQSVAVRTSLAILAWTANALLRLPSVVLSFADYLLARPFAFLAGATQKNTPVRYLRGAAVILGSALAGLFAPPPLGLYAVFFGIGAVLAVVRRWTWSEADREQFLVERKERDEVRRVGFGEDLRDEALAALTLLFVLIPIGLRQIQLATCAEGLDSCAFTLAGGGGQAQAPFASFLEWLGYFGAELAKSVPFVDWSEVFHVANQSPIKPKTALGSQAVFVMRAALDLLLLAAVLQAVQIAGRLRSQGTAFRASQLPILEPFAEARELRRAALGIEEAFELPPAEQNTIASFPAYDDERLRDIVRGDDASMEPAVRRAAAALLAKQHASEKTDQFFTERADAEPDPEMRAWVLRAASGLAPDRDAATREAAKARLEALLADRFEAAAVRREAARMLGRVPPAGETVARLFDALRDSSDDIGVRAAAAVALAKLASAEAVGPVEELAGEFGGPLGGEALVAAMAAAHALGRLAPSALPEDIARRFDAPLRPLALRAARIQAAPMTIEAASQREPGRLFDQLVRIAPGEGPFTATFVMGSGDGDDQAFDAEKPPTEITMTRPFAIGRYAVTQEEYLGFCHMTGRKPMRYSRETRWPAMEVSWRDAMAYCIWLAAITGEGYRLPTEAEWEFACRAGTKTRYSWGDDWDPAKAASVQTQSATGPRNVGSYEPNPWGLWDMHGNMYEWCADAWHETYADRPKDGAPWLEGGDFGLRVARGGSWKGGPQNLRSTLRSRYVADLRSDVIGFRLARTLSL